MDEFSISEITKSIKNNPPAKTLFLVGGIIIIFWFLLKRNQTQVQVPQSETQRFNSELSTFSQLSTQLEDIVNSNTSAFEKLNQLYTTGIGQLATYTERGLQALATGTQAGFTDVGTKITSLDTKLTGLNTAYDSKFASLETKIGGLETGLGTQFNTFKTAIESAFTSKFDAVNAGLTTQFTNLLNAVTNNSAKIDKVVNKDQFYFMLGSQSAASCFTPDGQIGSLECYNVKAPLDGLPYVSPDRYRDAENFVRSKYGSMVKGNRYDLGAIGKMLEGGTGGGGLPV